MEKKKPPAPVDRPLAKWAEGGCAESTAALIAKAKSSDNQKAAKLASKVGVTAEQSSKGLAAFLPMALGFLQESNADDLLAMLGKAGGLGDAVGKLKGIGKLFG